MAADVEQELVFAGPAELARQVRERELHPRELVEACLRRIEALDPRLNAFRVTRAEQALSEAERVRLDGLLAGVPVAVKDDLPVAGEATTIGSRSVGPPAAADAELVRRLREAGAIPIGITRVPELLIWPWTASKAGGVTRNPWDPERTTGGSSGGSAAAVAAGMVPCATASDGGGSIRIPAAACGLVGMKPTRGRTSSSPTGEGWLGLSVYGALARTVADSALLLDAMHGVLPGEHPAAPPFSGSYAEAAARPPARLRIAVSTKVPALFRGRLGDEQRRAWEQTAELLRELGHEVQERDPDYGLLGAHFSQLWLRGIYESSRALHDPQAVEPATRQVMTLGRWRVPPWRRRMLLARRERISRRVMSLWERFDVLLTPVLTTTAIAAEGAFGRSAFVSFDTAGRFMPWCPAFNVTGQPAVAIPAGVAADGLPLSVQLIGRRGAEDLLYSLAGQLEHARPWEHRRPSVS